MIPGIDLLDEAMGIIGTTEVLYRRFAGRTQNATRQFVNSYEEPSFVECSVQAASQKIYKQFNLDWQKKYVRVWASIDIINIDRDEAGDQFVWDNQTYQLTERRSWFIQDGWCGALAVAIGPALFTVITA